MPIKKLQALKDYFNNYFNRYNFHNTCINRRGYWPMLVVVVPCQTLVFPLLLSMVDYLELTFYSSHGFAFQAFIFSLYFILLCLVLLLYLVVIVVFVVITVYRCRDIGISTWYIFLIFVPYINIAFLIVMGCLEKDAVKKYRLSKNKKTDLSKTLLQALKDCYNKYFRGDNTRNVCIDRRVYRKMLAVFLPCHILVFSMTYYLGMVDYLDLNFDPLPSFDFQALVSWSYFIPFCLLLLFYLLVLALFFTIAAHRCRDIGISPWYTLLFFVDYLRIVFLIVLGCLEKDAMKKHSLRKNKKNRPIKPIA